MISMGNALNAVIILDRKVAGTWRKVLKKNKIEVSLNPFREFSEAEHNALNSEMERLGKFVGALPVLK